MVTLKDIAALAKVSPATVSRVLNTPKLVCWSRDKAPHSHNC